MRNPISIACKFIAELTVPRSPKWRTVEKHHIATEGWCRKCGSTKDLQVHHCIPFHHDPTLELDPKDLLTLCETSGVECHLKHGHLGNWKQFNPNVRDDLSPMPGVPASKYKNEIDQTITAIKS